MCVTGGDIGSASVEIGVSGGEAVGCALQAGTSPASVELGPMSPPVTHTPLRYTPAHGPISVLSLARCRGL